MHNLESEVKHELEIINKWIKCNPLRVSLNYFKSFYFIVTLHQRGWAIKAPGLSSTWPRFKIYSRHSVASLKKTLYGTFPCLMVLASRSKLKSYLY